MHVGPDGHFHECVSMDYSTGDIWGSTWYSKVCMLEGISTMGSLKFIFDGALSPMTGQKVRYNPTKQMLLCHWKHSEHLLLCECNYHASVKIEFQHHLRSVLLKDNYSI